MASSSFTLVLDRQPLGYAGGEAGEGDLSPCSRFVFPLRTAGLLLGDGRARLTQIGAPCPTRLGTNRPPRTAALPAGFAR
jgi:hypothetical protein